MVRLKPGDKGVLWDSFILGFIFSVQSQVGSIEIWRGPNTGMGTQTMLNLTVVRSRLNFNERR
jgi:hypothetical protein